MTMNISSPQHEAYLVFRHSQKICSPLSTRYERRFTLARRAYFTEVATKAESPPGRRSQEATMAESAQRAGTKYVLQRTPLADFFNNPF